MMLYIIEINKNNTNTSCQYIKSIVDYTEQKEKH